ncbi:MAG: hypothetical protein H9535_19305 [Ignavibacteria bacterium]|nr:hypothetical protein [Ignavibacteria bacterium]
MSRHGFPSVDDNEFWLVLVITAVPIALLLERLLARNSAADAASLLSLEIEARKAKLRKQIEETKGDGRQ